MGVVPAPVDLAAHATELLRELIRFDTVNPPGNELPVIEYLRCMLEAVGFQCELLAAESHRPNLVARLRGEHDGSTLCYLGHVDTVLADPREWTHAPFSGDLADGFIWGRGALDMKSQVAAEVAAAASLAAAGWRPARGELLVVAVADEETGGGVGAEWLTQHHPDKVRCDMLLNEGGGPSFEVDGQRFYGVCCAEKGVFRFTVKTAGVAGHASMPRMGENALLKMAPVLERFARVQPSLRPTAEPLALLAGIGEDTEDPAAALGRLAEREPRLAPLFEPMFGVTFTPTKISASEKINVIPSSAELRVDCRVPPGLGEAEVLQALEEVLGGIEGLALELPGSPSAGSPSAGSPSAGSPSAGPPSAGSLSAGSPSAGSLSAGPPSAGSLSAGSPSAAGERDTLRIDFTEQIMGNRSPMQSPLREAIAEWLDEHDPGARTVPTILPGFTDSAHFRAAFPECVAYGFFPHRHQGLLETQPLIHAADERIDMRDMALGAQFYRDMALRLLG